MDNFRYVNAGDSTLSAGIVAGDTQISVANPGRFPAALEVGEKLVLTLHPSGLPSTQEIVICTAISGGVMTVTRGAQGTTAQGWPAGTVVGAYLTSEMLGQIRDKLMPISGTNTGDETAARIGTLTAGAAAKTTPVDADLIGLADSAASNTLKKLTWSALKAALKTYFDTLYNKYVHPNHSGDVTSVADGAQTIAANAVTNLKLADMANSTIKGRITAGAGDPEDLTATHVRTILNVANGAQKNSDITKAEIEAKLTGTIASHSHPEMIPAGTVFMYAGATVPTGYLRCNGAAVSRTTYAALFAAIGTRYGAGDGSTTFNLPEVRGEFPRFWDNGREVDSGRVLGSWQGDAISSHTHALDSQGMHAHTVRGTNTSGDGIHIEDDNSNPNGGNHATVSTSSAGAHTHTVYATGGSENRPRNVAFLGIIKF